MARRLSTITLVTIILITTVATLWPAPVSAQQLFPAGRREVTLSTGFISGVSNFTVNLSYGLPESAFDVLFRATSSTTGGVTATGFVVAGRYHFALEFEDEPQLDPYVLAGFTTATAAGLTASGFLLGVGAAFTLSGPLSAYGTLTTNTSGGGLGYDFGVQFGIAEQFSLLVGFAGASVSGVSSSAAYAGFGFRF